MEDAYHIMIGVDHHFDFSFWFLIFPLASLFVFDLTAVLYSHQQLQDVNEALLSAQSQAKTSGIFGKILQAFPYPAPNIKDDQIIKLILNNRLGMLNAIADSDLMCS